MSARPDLKPTGNPLGRAGRNPGGHGEQKPWTRAVPAARGEGEGRPALFPDESSLAASAAPAPPGSYKGNKL